MFHVSTFLPFSEADTQKVFFYFILPIFQIKLTRKQRSKERDIWETILLLLFIKRVTPSSHLQFVNQFLIVISNFPLLLFPHINILILQTQRCLYCCTEERE